MIKTALIFLSLFGVLRQELIRSCPPPEEIPQCVCCPGNGPNMACRQLYDPWKLKIITTLLSKYKVPSLLLNYVYLTYLPKGMFTQLHLTAFEIFNCKILGLESDNGREMFEGLEYSLQSLYFHNATGMDSWRWSPFTYLKALKKLTIKRGDLNAITDSFISVFPNSLTVIRFPNNKISRVHKNAFSNHVNLEELDLSGNRIVDIDRAMFPNPAKKLRKIRLLDNKISTIPDDFFANMPKLEYVYLAWNRIQFLNQKMFQPLQRGQRFVVDLRNNQIFCCENLKFLITAGYKTFINVVCHNPQALRGKHINSLTQVDLLHGFC